LDEFFAISDRVEEGEARLVRLAKTVKASQKMLTIGTPMNEIQISITLGRRREAMIYVPLFKCMVNVAGLKGCGVRSTS
jgi:hypothetical protein